MSVSEIKSTKKFEADLTFHLSDVWKGFVKFWAIGVVLAVLFGSIMFYRSYVSFSPVYKATATFTVHTENATLSGDGGLSAYSFYYDRGTADHLASVFPYVIQSNILQRRVCEDLGTQNMPAGVSASCVSGTNMVTLTATGTDPEMTYKVLLSVIDNYPYVTEYMIGNTRMIMIAEPEMPETPVNKLSWRSSTAKGALVGLGIGVFWILLYAVLRRTIRTKEDIRKELNQSCIGILPQVTFKRHKKKIDTSILISNPLVGNAFMESMRLLRDSVSNGLKENEKVIMVTSTAPGEGKSSTVLNLAGMFAKNGSRVLVIDGDLRNSGISKILGARDNGKSEKKDGAAYEISKLESLGADLFSFNTDVHHLWKIMRSEHFKSIVDSLRDKYDYIFIDTPPCGTISDAAAMAGAADAAIYIIKQDTVLTSSIRNGINTLLSTDIRLIGTVMSMASTGMGGYGNYYGYAYNGYKGYGYRYSEKHKVKRKHGKEV
ncbi:MAG: P-loop NTPase [Clostridia bacterium]|nr:P-loop NTPase [Clostridia bacterium]